MLNLFRSFGSIGLVVGFLTLGGPSAQAAVTRLVTSGTTANLNLVVSTPGSRPDCTIDIWLVLGASTSVTRTDHTTSTGAVGFLQRMDNCADEFEFGSFNVSLPSTAFTTASGSATLNASFPVVLDSSGPAGGTVTRNLIISSVRFAALENNSVASRTFGLIRAPAFTLITRGRSIFNGAGITGSIKLDGANLLTSQATTTNSIETGSSATIDITK
ncbi:MAG: hypothetical protein ABJA82_05180 [Myxococcales bacterium]